jgi:thioredoxin-dependent peroxiredoxin
MSRSTRTTFVIDKTGTVRFVYISLLFVLSSSPKYRAVLDAMLDYGAHAKFVHKELDKLEAEEKKEEVDATVPANEQQEPAVTAV